MSQKPTAHRAKNRLFLAFFLLITPFTWAPLGYGSYGPSRLVCGIPSWAAVALGTGAILFVLEWVYLFKTEVSLNDRHLANVLAALKQTGPAASAGKE